MDEDTDPGRPRALSVAEQKRRTHMVAIAMMEASRANPWMRFARPLGWAICLAVGVVLGWVLCRFG